MSFLLNVKDHFLLHPLVFPLTKIQNFSFFSQITTTTIIMMMTSKKRRRYIKFELNIDRSIEYEDDFTHRSSFEQ